MQRRPFLKGLCALPVVVLLGPSGCGGGKDSGQAVGDVGDVGYDTEVITVYITNATEVPVYIQLQSDGQAGATFTTTGTTSCTVQPGDSTAAKYTNADVFPLQQAFNLVYSFYDGTSIDQRCSNLPQDSNCAKSSSSGLFGVSDGYFVNESFAGIDVGASLASMFGLTGNVASAVATLIDAIAIMANLSPTPGGTDYWNYSITISQKDYNFSRLTDAGWYVDPNRPTNTPPPISLAYQTSIQQYLNGAWQTPVPLPGKATTGYFYQATSAPGLLLSCFGTNSNTVVLGIIQNGTPQPLLPTVFSDTSGVTQLSINLDSSPTTPIYVAAFADYVIQYFDGTNVNILHDDGWDSTITMMVVNWVSDGPPQVLVGLSDGAVEYYDGQQWTQLQSQGWNTSILQLSAYWNNSTGTVQCVAGLGDGSIQYWNGSTWTQLHDNGWQDPVYQMSAVFDGTGGSQPSIIVGLFDGDIVYYQGFNGSWTSLRTNDENYAILDVSWDVTTPTLVAGFSDGSVALYVGGTQTWTPLQAATGNRVQMLSVHWKTYSLSNNVLEYVISRNLQYTYGNWTAATNYPAIPSS